MHISDEEKAVIIEFIEDGYSSDDIRQLFPGLTDGSIAAYRAHVTRGTYEETSYGFGSTLSTQAGSVRGVDEDRTRTKDDRGG